MDEAAAAGRVLVMDQCMVVLDGTPREVFRNVEEMRRRGLDVPQITALAYALRQYGIPISDTILTIDEFIGDPYINELLSLKRTDL